MSSRMTCAMLVVAASMAIASVAVGRAQSALPRGEVVLPDGTRVAVEVASTPATRERGLMFRTRMGTNEGMVFVFPESGHYPFWMKNTLIPLDIVWVDQQLRVVHVAASVPPCKADPCPTFPPPPSPKGDASYVVELASGVAAQHGLKAGDTLVFRNVPPPTALAR